MTDREHQVWIQVCAASKRGEWYAPAAHGDRIVAAELHRRGYMQRRRPLRLGKAYRRAQDCPPGEIPPPDNPEVN